MYTPKIARQLRCVAFLAVVISPASNAQTVQLGEPISEAELSEFDLIVSPDGSGLPAGNGSVKDGQVVFETKCAACHGLSGEGVSGNTVLVGGDMHSAENPLKTVGSYWPYATTVFDFIRRAMPANAPKSLSNDEVYQVTAYVLYLNGIISESTALDKASLSQIKMPNKDGFIDLSHLH
ncbi:MAG: c-type cytochrome [Pseudohongiellaceae bacterium]